MHGQLITSVFLESSIDFSQLCAASCPLSFASCVEMCPTGLLGSHQRSFVAQLDSWRRKEREWTKERQELLTRVDAQAQAQQDTSAQLTVEKQQLQETVTALRAQCQLQATELQTSTHGLEEAQRSVAALTAQNRALQEQVTATQHTLVSAREVIATLEQQRDQVKEQAKDKPTETQNELQLLVRKLTEDKQSLVAEIRENTRLIQEMDMVLQQHAAEKASAEKSAQRWQREKEEWAAQSDAFLEQIAQLKGIIARSAGETHEETRRLQDKCKQLESELSARAAGVTASSHQTDEQTLLRQQVTTLSEALTVAKQAQQLLEKKMEAMEAADKGKKEKFEKVVEMAKQYRTKSAALEAEVTALRQAGASTGIGTPLS